jgi:hypothetical protein
MKQLKLLLGIAVTLMVGCSEQDETNQDRVQQQNKICLGAEIDQVYETRANDQGFADGDQMGVYIVDYNGDTPGTLLSKGNRGDNVRYTLDEANHHWNSAYDVYWKDRHTHIDIYGYYPFSDTNPDDVNNWTFEVQKDQSTDATASELGGYEQSDLLWGKVTDVAPTDRIINLPLTHRMSSIRLELTEGSYFEEGEYAALEKAVVIKGMRRSAIVNLATGSVIPTGTDQSESIVPYQYNGHYRAIVVPQTIEANAPLFEFNIGGESYSFKKSEAFEFVPGKMHNFTIRIDKRIPTGDYEFTLIGESITAWENDDVTHDAIMREYVIINSTPRHLKDSIMAAGQDYTKLRNLKVTGEISDEDFYFMNNEMPHLSALNLRDVLIKEGNESADKIPNGAFYGKTSLTSIVLPQQLKEIGEAAFRECTNLTGSLIIPEGVEKIGDWAFLFGRNLTGTLSLPSTLKELGGGVFRACGFVCELKLPENLKIIGAETFLDCRGFYGEIQLPSDLEVLGGSAFRNMKNVSGSIQIPQGVTSIQEGCFAESGFNGTLTLHDGITSIGNEAFKWTPLKGELYIPKDLEVLGADVFNGCDFSGELVLPAGLRSIGDEAFANNWRLMGILQCPPALEHIGYSAFYGCSMLEGVVFNAGLSSIGSGAFGDCFGIGSLVCKGTMPAYIQSGAFDGVAKDNFTLEVPESAISQYQAAPGWNEFKRIAAHHELVCRPSVACAINTEAKRRLVLNAEGNWEVVSKPDWCSLSQMSGSSKTELTLTIHQMAAGSEMREGEIVFRLKDKDYTHKCTVRQYDYPYAEDEIITLQKATRGNNGGINIFIVGDGYDAKEISEGKLMKDMQDEIAYFFDIEPYKTYRDYFNVYTGIAISTESGVGTVNTIRYNRFNTTFTGGVGLRADYDALFSYAKRAETISDGNIDQTLIIVVPNSTDYGGICQMWESGAAIAFCPKSTYGYPLDSRGVIQHEAGGHGFGKLGDEYIYHNVFIDFCDCTCCGHVLKFNFAKSYGWYDNLELTGKMHEVGWSHLIFDPRYSDIVDIYEGGFMHSRGVFRSEQNSCMNNDIPYYSTISRESIVRRIKRYAGEEFSFEDFVAHDSREAGTVTRAFDMPWTGSLVRHHQHTPVIHKGSPVKK